MEVDSVKHVARNGTSLSINMTKELRMLGLDAGDLVHITISKPLENSEE